MKTVNQIVAEEINKDRIENLLKLSNIRDKLRIAEDEEMALIIQSQCDHIWEVHGNGGMYGGYDSDKCKICGRIYEF